MAAESPAPREVYEIFKEQTLALTSGERSTDTRSGFHARVLLARPPEIRRLQVKSAHVYSASRVQVVCQSGSTVAQGLEET